MRDDLQIPYGASDFKTLRVEKLYYVDKSVPALARGTTLHQIVFQFRGTELVRIEHIAEEAVGC
ncbi:MAG: hypothetical protein IKE55_01230 [Kiritimatiellae bacterium]|nr:hypothetical protein [Kiritimatiellia bacterium]